MVATAPGLAETLSRDWRKAAGFFGRFVITETLFRHGVALDEAAEHDLIERVETRIQRWAQ